MSRPYRNSQAICACIVAILSMTAVQGAEKLKPMSRAVSDQDVEFEVYLPLQNTDALDRLIAEQHTPGSANYQRWLTPQEFRERFGPSSAQLARVTRALQSYGFEVTRTHSQGVHVRGKVNTVEGAFAVSLWNAQTPAGQTRLIASEAVKLPPSLSREGAKILHFSPTLQKHPHSHVMAEIPDNRYGSYGPYWFDDLKQAYAFPSYQSLTGKGRTIAIVMSSDFQASDIAAYFTHEKLATPKIVRRPVEGGAKFNPNSGASFEVELDLEQAGGMAPGATLMLYNIPDLFDDSILAGYLDIVEDNRADIVSSSFGGPEGQYTAPYNDGVDQTGVLNVFSAVFKQGNAQGITFVASSGDSGALGLYPLSYITTPPQTPPVVVGSWQLGIQTPASDPNVTAVGGTAILETKHVTGDLDSTYVKESAFSDPLNPSDLFGVGNLLSGGYFGPGGGISIVFSKPAYQKLVTTGSKMRTVPDISLLCGGCPTDAASCDPNDSYAVESFNGKLYGVIGTSVAAPGFAGLIALEEENLGGIRLGNVNYQIYAQSALQASGSSPYQFFHPNIQGFDGVYKTHKGYNLVTGNGTPIGVNFIMAPEVPPAGTPQTPSNP